MARQTSSGSSSDTAADVDEQGPNPSSRQFSPLAALSWVLLSPQLFFIWIVQKVVEFIYEPLISSLFTAPAPPKGSKPFGRIAVIGGGLTGIASAAHAVAHGFEVVIYESEEEIGGVWARVNSTSSLQLNSILYRFHPSVKWSCGFPHRDEIVGQIRALADRYQLHDSIRLKTKVEKVTRHKSSTDPKKGGHARWLINDGKDGVFDGIIVAIGTCGEPKNPHFEGEESFKGEILHSSKLDDAHLEGKKVVIVGSGASGVEAAELAVAKKAKDVVVLARDDKWIIPRNTVFDIMLALQPFGREMPLSFIPEWLIRTFHYRDQVDKAPQTKGLFAGTPIVNDEFLKHIRKGLISYKRGDTKSFTPQGVKFNERERDSKPGDKGETKVETADVIVLATGFTRPSIEMLPADLFPKESDGRDYSRPNLYLQNFCTEDCSILLTNASYMDAIGTVGNWHVGLYARILMLFLLEERARPVPKAMKLWVDLLQWIKQTAWGNTDVSGLAFFTYTELVIWILTFHLFKPRRLPWLPFVLFGWGVKPSASNETEGKVEKK
ncbi:hypothetical protein BCR35DRAFT_299182 [Leucosporidium creatinivorum]|uniref:FAD/NAD(P)-binding domain-containing protein n=1 Tax=Leucosporidium creatinivorum TaxID=106004 RepID=A0A1Y2G157_9BASI|nr:hypothetical protein BCR35DRAFT_299182 [Leucosporidium creatinivorum]